jgi:hypothetical protein
MGSLIWIEEPGDIDLEIQTTQKILILEQIWIYYNYDHKTFFSEKCVNTKVVENVVGFSESKRTQESEFV